MLSTVVTAARVMLQLRSGTKTEMRNFNNNKIQGNEELMLVILNCNLLHDRNDGWTVPYPYLMVCFQNIY
jgi:hypothetical protein